MRETRQRQRRTSLRKSSRQKRDTRVATGHLDSQLDFVCPFCNEVYSHFRGREQLHLRKCKARILQTTKAPPKLQLPSPPPFEHEQFPMPAVTGEYTIEFQRFPPRSSASQDPGDADVSMDEPNFQTTLGSSGSDPSPSLLGDVDMAHEPPSIGVNPAAILQPGETLIVYHPYSRCPMRITPTAELYGPHEHTTLHNIKTPEAAYAPFPTRADFEQAEIFINNNCSNKFIDTQLKFACSNGMQLKVKSSHVMHQLLARGIEEDPTGDSKVCLLASL